MNRQCYTDLQTCNRDGYVKSATLCFKSYLQRLMSPHRSSSIIIIVLAFPIRHSDASFEIITLPIRHLS